MPLTICEQIEAVIETRLRTLLSPGENTVASDVIRPKTLEELSPEDLQIVLTQGDTTINEELMCPGNPPATCFETTFNIRCRVMPDETQDLPSSGFAQQFAADVRKVICTPVSTWHTFGGLAFDARWQGVERVNSEAFSGVVLPIVVMYRTDEGNPYVGRA